MAKIATFSDNFATRDTTKWNYSNSKQSVTGGQLHLNGGVFLVSKNTYDLTSSQVHAEIVNPTARFGFGAAGLTDGTGGTFVYLGGTGYLEMHSGDGGDTGLEEVEYDPAAHRWLRIRESGGTIFWEASANKAAWATLYSLEYPASTSSLVVFVGDGAVFDNVNL